MSMKFLVLGRGGILGLGGGGGMADFIFMGARTFLKDLHRGPPTIYRHHKGLRIKKGISKGVVYELSEPKRTAKCIPPPGLHWRCSSCFLWGWCTDCGVRSQLLTHKNFL